jgi:hypothetical protein
MIIIIQWNYYYKKKQALQVCVKEKIDTPLEVDF